MYTHMRLVKYILFKRVEQKKKGMQNLVLFMNALHHSIESQISPYEHR